jgi:hypothetical protein
MNSTVLKWIGFAVGTALVAVGNSGAEIPIVPASVLAQLGALLVGWSGLRQPGTVKK